jgi:hypothetical protein
MAAAVANPFPIGTPGKPWGDEERAEWLRTRVVKRSYKDEVLSKIDALKERFEVSQYGALSHDVDRYPLFVVKTKNWDAGKPHVLITGGVHGYETSGVQGALLFLQQRAEELSAHFNILVAPCVSPWGYETIQRWNPQAIDPNRSFNPDGERVPGRSFNPEGATEESAALIAHIKSLGVATWIAHLDLHETTDTDESEFRPAKSARDGLPYTPGTIPDGFYLASCPTSVEHDAEFHKAAIEAVRRVTHIAPPDAEGKIIGEPVAFEGVIVLPAPAVDLGLCSSIVRALHATTTEVYPDSATASPEQCNEAQVACVEGALQYLINKGAR